MDLEHGFDALLPPAMANQAEDVGVCKASMPAPTLLVLAVLAGAFISLGGVFSTTVAAGSATLLPWGVTRLLSGVSFSLGLILVCVGGGELLTGNTLIGMAWANGRVATTALLRNWALVYVGNFMGALGTAALMYVAGQYTFGEGALGAAVLATAAAKTSLVFTQAVALGGMGNALVCLAVWLA